jgi:hypothetical protein
MSSFGFSLLGISVAFQFSQRVKEDKVLSLGILLSLIVLFVAQYVIGPYRKLPPGPRRGYPIIGNALELRTHQWLKFTEWRKQYGPWLFSVVILLSFDFLSV